MPQLRVLRTGVGGESGGVRYCAASLLASPPVVAAASAARFGVSVVRTRASSVGRCGGCWEGRSTGGASASGSPYRCRRGSDGGVRYPAASLLASFFHRIILLGRAYALVPCLVARIILLGCAYQPMRLLAPVPCLVDWIDVGRDKVVAWLIGLKFGVLRLLLGCSFLC